MNRTDLCRLAAAAILLCLPLAGFAQYESSEKSRFGLSLELARPSGEQLTDLKALWLGPNLIVNIKHDSHDRPTIVASLGWFGESDSNGEGSFVPIRVSFIKRFDKESMNGWYVGAGLDSYYVKYEGYDYDPFTRQSAWVNESSMPFGFNFLCGKEWRDGAWFAELKIDAVDGLSLPTGSSVSFSGVSLSFGSRMTM